MKHRETCSCVCVCNICETRAACTDHGVTQYVGGLAQLVLRDSAVQQDGPQQAGVVQVDVVVPLLQPHNTQLPSICSNYSPNSNSLE